jgi:hypothetical protein
VQGKATEPQGPDSSNLLSRTGKFDTITLR